MSQTARQIAGVTYTRLTGQSVLKRSLIKPVLLGAKRASTGSYDIAVIFGGAVQENKTIHFHLCFVDVGVILVLVFYWVIEKLATDRIQVEKD